MHFKNVQTTEVRLFPSNLLARGKCAEEGRGGEKEREERDKEGTRERSERGREGRERERKMGEVERCRGR